MYKIASWNVNSLNVRLEHVKKWLIDKDIDVLALQEIKMTDDKFPITEFENLGYQVSFAGQKAYNGVALISKNEISDVVTDFPEFSDPSRRVLAATINGVRILNVYIPNGQDLESDKFQYKLNWLSHLHLFVKDQLSQHSRMVILGDFNIAPENSDVYDHDIWQDKILVSDDERDAFKDLLELGFKDSFRLFEQEEKIFSWWDYRMRGFQRKMGLRIDHILLSEQLEAQCKSSQIDKEPRGWERPSDHAPCWVELQL